MINTSHFLTHHGLTHAERIDPVTTIDNEPDAQKYIDAWARWERTQNFSYNGVINRTQALLIIASNIRYFQREWDAETSDRVQKLFMIPIATEIYESIVGEKP